MAGPAAHLQMPKLQNFLIGAGIVEPPAPATVPPPIRKERHAVRPPVKHEWSSPQPGVETKPHIFQHELLQTFSLSLFCKVSACALRIILRAWLCLVADGFFGVMINI